jgi:acyl-CoA reductase-like NAD-dependent aldehyde dehydrogenase
MNWQVFHEFDTKYGLETRKDMANIINKNRYDRVMSLLNSTKGTIYSSSGNSTFPIKLTLVTDLSPTDALFGTEIFAPILPILTYKTLSETTQIISKIDPTPLGICIMTEDQAEANFIVDHTQSCGVTGNHLATQAAATGMPFGGVGTSSNGNFHGKSRFDIFTNFRRVCMVPTDEGFEAMVEVRYATGDMERKYHVLKQMEEKVV